MKLKEQTKTWYAVFRTWSRFGDRRIFYKNTAGLHRLAAAFACLGLSDCCAQPGSAMIPHQAADYDASLQDERTAYVANKARSLTFFICIYAQLLAVLAAILVFHQPLIGKVLCALTCIQSLVYTGCYWYYNRTILMGRSCLEIPTQQNPNWRTGLSPCSPAPPAG